MEAIEILANACSKSDFPSIGLDTNLKNYEAVGSGDDDASCATDTKVADLEENEASSGAESLSIKVTCRGNWTIEEDEKLRKAVAEFGGRNWKKIAEQIPDRTDVQCLHRWQKVLRPGLIKGNVDII